jgi:ribonuclease P protein component
LLPKRSRLKSGREIKAILKEREFESKGPLLSLVARENSLGHPRLAVVTPRTLGRAVDRNRLRRVFQAAFANIWRKKAKNIDIVLFPRQKALGLKTDQAEKALWEQLMKLA